MERYKSIIDDFEAFKNACEREKVYTVRKNPLKAREDFETALNKNFESVERAEWNPNIYRLPGAEKAGDNLMHWTGEYYVQEEPAALPVTVLDPQPGEKVLDTCAAPGGKSTQIAARMENNGEVVANDVSKKRMKAMHANTYRTGSAAIRTTTYEAQSFPSREFDRVLVDAPCTGEGDRARRTFEPAERDESRNLAELQKLILERASELVKDGGTVVYSTCTVAPWENEAAVKWALEKTGLMLERIETGIEHVRGVERFDGEHYGPEMRKTVRVYPQHLDSGVIYAAKFTA